MINPLQAAAAPPPAVYQAANVLVFPARWQLCIVEIVSRGTYSTAFTDLTEVKDDAGNIFDRTDVRVIALL